MKDALQTVRLGKSANEPKTRYEQTNEDRLNENFRMMQDEIESLRAEIDRLRNGA